MIREQPGYFSKWAWSRQMAAKIDAHLARGGNVYIATHTRSTRFTMKHRGMIQARRDGIYMQRGRSWDFVAGMYFGAAILFR